MKPISLWGEGEVQGSSDVDDETMTMTATVVSSVAGTGGRANAAAGGREWPWLAVAQAPPTPPPPPPVLVTVAGAGATWTTRPFGVVVVTTGPFSSPIGATLLMGKRTVCATDSLGVFCQRTKRLLRELSGDMTEGRRGPARDEEQGMSLAIPGLDSHTKSDHLVKRGVVGLGLRRQPERLSRTALALRNGFQSHCCQKQRRRLKHTALLRQMARPVYLVRHGESTYNQWRRKSYASCFCTCAVGHCCDPLIRDVSYAQSGSGGHPISHRVPQL